MASVSSDYSEVFVDGGSGGVAATANASEGVVYSEVLVGGENSSHQTQQMSKAAKSWEQQQQIVTTTKTTTSRQVAAPSQQQQQNQIIMISNDGAASISGQQVSASNAQESPLAGRIVGYGFQSLAIEDESAATGQTTQTAKKESAFGTFRRSFGKGKKKRIQTGYASNFANSGNILMKGWLHKQDSGGFHLWKRRWFVLRGNELFYYKSPKDNGALGCVKLSAGQRIAPTDDNISKKYSFRITKEGERTYVLAADNKETLTNWMNAISLTALGIPPETIVQSLSELKPSATLGRSTSTSNGHSTFESQSASVVRGSQSGRVQPAASQLQSATAFKGPVAGSESTNGFVVTSSVLGASGGARVGTSANATTIQLADAETHAKTISKSLQSIDVSEASDDEDDEEKESSDEEEESDDESSRVSSEMEQIEGQRRKAHQLQSANVDANFFGNLMQQTNITENINKTENININKTENININEKVNIDHEVHDQGLHAFFGTGQHITGVNAGVNAGVTTGATNGATTGNLAIKPPTYQQVSNSGSNVKNGVQNQAPPGRSAQVLGNLSEWQNRTTQRPPSANRYRIANAGDTLSQSRNRTKSADDYLDGDPGQFHRTQSMRSLKMWMDHQKTTGRSRGPTPEPDQYLSGGNQQPIIMDLDKNERLYVNPSTTTLVRSKSRQGHQTLTKSSGALVPVQTQPQRPSTAMGHGGTVALVSRDQVTMQRNYQMQMYLRQQYLAAQQQQQQQQHALMMQQQMQQQQAMLLQQQIKQQEELLRKKKEKDMREKEKRKQREREMYEQQQLEEQLKRSTTIVNESVTVSNDPKVKRVFVRRVQKVKSPTPPPAPITLEKREFSMQTIVDSGCQTEVVEPAPPPTFSETLIVQTHSPSPAPVRFVETVEISPPTPVESDAESEEEWEVLVSSDQNSWNMVARETLPSRVIRAASLSNLEAFVAEQLSSETQKVLEDAEEVRFSEEVIQTILTKTVEDTTTTNTTKTISMVTEGESSLDGVYIGDVEEDDDIILPAITVGGGVGSALAQNDAHLGTSKTTTVTKVSTDPFQDTQVESYSTDEGEGKVMSTKFHQGHATIVDDKVAFDYASSDEAKAEFQRQLLQMQQEFGEAGNVSSDSGMSYQTPSGSNVSVQQNVTTVKSGVQVSTTGDHLQQQQHRQLQAPQQQQAPEISITDLDTNQVLTASNQSYTGAFNEPALQVSCGETGGVDVSLGDFRIAAIKRRVSTVPDGDFTPPLRLTPDRDAASSVSSLSPSTQTTQKTYKGILKKSPRPSSSSSDHADASQFTEQFMNTISHLHEGQLKTTKTERRPSISVADASLPDPVVKSSTIVVDANSPATGRKAASPASTTTSASHHSSRQDISIESPSTKHYSTHLHKTISPRSTPTLVVEVDPSAKGAKSTTVLTTTLNGDATNQKESSPSLSSSSGLIVESNLTGASVAAVESATKPTTILTTTLNNNDNINNNINIISKEGSPFIVESNMKSTSSISVSGNQSAQGSITLGQVITGSDSGSAQFISESQSQGQNLDAEVAHILNEEREMNARTFSKSEASLTGAVMPPLEQDMAKVKERFMKRSESSESVGAIGRKLIAIKRENEAKETTLTYFSRRLKEEEGALEIITKGGDNPYNAGRLQTQTASVAQLREKVEGIEKSIAEGKAKVEALEAEWKRVKPDGDVDLLASLSRSTSTSRSELVVGGGGGAAAAAAGDATESTSGAAGGSTTTTVVKTGGSSSSSSSITIDTKESKAVAVEKEAMRSVLSTISSQFTSKNIEFDRLRREEEEIKALLASRMRGIDLEIGQIEAQQQKMEIEQTLEDLEADSQGVVVVSEAQERVETA